MPTLTLYNFNKKRNSTKQPSGGTSRGCVLKESTSLESPTFILESYDSSWSYCSFMGRFYYIDDVIFSSNKLYELRCSTDVLATYKSEILKVDCNILYCDGSTKNIIDQRIPLTADYKVNTNTVQFDHIAFSKNGGAIILGITGKGSFGSYILEYTNKIASVLDGLDSYTSLFTDTLEAVKQIFYGGSAAENLKSAIKLPLVFNPEDVSGGKSAEQLRLGNYPCMEEDGTPIRGWHIQLPVLTDTKTITIPWQYSDWRRNAPYSEVILYLPCIGMIAIPSGAILEESGITITYSINITSGDIAASYSGSTTGRIIGTASGNIAMATPYGSTGVDTTKMTNAVVAGLGTLVTGAAALATGGASLGLALSMGGGLSMAAMSSLSALGGSGSGSGGLGGGAVTGLDTDIHCYCITRTLSAEQSTFNPIMGKPFMQVDKISNHVGFVMTEGFSVNIAGLGQDKDTINKMMDSGVYIE